MSEFIPSSNIHDIISQKIRLVVRQQQEGKTFIAIKDIERKIRDDSLIIIFTMNTIKSQMQFFERLANCVKDNITVFNSKDILKDLDEKEKYSLKIEHVSKFTHIYEMLSENKIKILFMCSNNTRINETKNIVDMLDKIDPRKKKYSSVYIYQDEAHKYLDINKKKNLSRRNLKYGKEFSISKESTTQDLLNLLDIHGNYTLKLALEDGTFLNKTDNLGQIYKQYHNKEDNILYILVTKETTLYHYLLSIIKYLFRYPN